MMSKASDFTSKTSKEKQEQEQGQMAAQTQKTDFVQESATCPEVEIMDNLRHMVEFTDVNTPSPESETARIYIQNIRSSCQKTLADTQVQISLTFEAQLGPKGRLGEKNDANFAFPYFVAATSGDGSVLAKEVFAVSTTFKPGQNTAQQYETVTQKIPVSVNPAEAAQKILIGFQLTEEQLAYNRAHFAAQ